MVRQSCAHLNDTTITGERKPPPVAPDSYIREFKKKHPEAAHYDNDVLVLEFRDAWYPLRSFEEVREWLYRSQKKYGPMPPRED